MEALREDDVCKIIAVSNVDSYYLMRANLIGKKVKILSIYCRWPGGYIACRVKQMYKHERIVLCFRSVKLEKIKK